MIQAIPIDEITGQATGTPTPNPTLLSVARMLTETAAAPTVTITPSPTPTRVTTATHTVEVVLEGSQKKPAPAGQPFTLGDIQISVLDIQLSDSAGRLKAQEDQTYLDVEILLSNLGQNPISYTPFYLSLASASGQRYQPAVDSLHPGLLSGSLRAGAQVRGHVAFAIPEPPAEITAGDFQLVFRPELTNLPPDSQLREAWMALPSPGNVTEVSGDMPNWAEDGLPGPGERIEATGVRLKVTQVSVKNQVEFGKAEQGNQFVVLDVEIGNTDHPRLPYNSLYFRVKDGAGYEYMPTAGPAETSLQAGTLGPYQTVTGELIFEVPLSDKQLVLSFLPTVISENYEEIRIEITVSSPGR